MNTALKYQDIIILTDKGGTLKPGYSKEDKVKDVYAGNFLEIKIFYKKMRKLNRKTTMYALISDGEFIDVELEYSKIENPSVRKNLEEIFRTGSKLNILFVLKKKSFDNLYKRDLKEIIPNMEDENLIFVGGASIKNKLIADENWDEGFHFFKRVGMARIGKKNQKKIIELMELKEVR